MWAIWLHTLRYAYTSLACDMTSASEVAVSGLRRSTSVICLCLLSLGIDVLAHAEPIAAAAQLTVRLNMARQIVSQ